MCICLITEGKALTVNRETKEIVKVTDEFFKAVDLAGLGSHEAVKKLDELRKSRPILSNIDWNGNFEEGKKARLQLPDPRYAGEDK